MSFQHGEFPVRVIEGRLIRCSEVVKFRSRACFAVRVRIDSVHCSAEFPATMTV